MGALINLRGKRFGRLTVTQDAPVSRNRKVRWQCVCDCGSELSVLSDSLMKSRTISCGCYRDEKIGNDRRTHGACQTPEYAAWSNMKSRCSEASEDFEYYRGRGIVVCDQWQHNFEAFLAEVGPRPSPKQQAMALKGRWGQNP